MGKANNTPDLMELKEMLQHGDQKKIAEDTGYDKVYVSAVLNGKQELNTENIVIVEAAMKYATAAKERVNKSISKLNKFLSDSKA